jgi:hypothetical protein
MPANTPNGYPYPLGTDRVMDGDDSIHSLADAVDTKLRTSAAGVATITVAVGAATGNVAVTFPAGRFLAAPAVQVTANAAPTAWFGGAGSITATGAIIYASQRDGTNVTGSPINIPTSWTATAVG